MTLQEKSELKDYLQVNLDINKVEAAIVHCESEMNKIAKTDFHQIIGKNLDHLIDPLILWIDSLYVHVSREIDIKAMYCEMNEFAGNTDLWFIDLFALDNYQGTEDLDWLADYQTGHHTVLIDPDYDGPLPNGYTKLISSFTITSWESLQSKFDWVGGLDENGEPNYKKMTLDDDNAEVYCRFLVVLKLQELFKKTYEKASALKKYSWTEIPIIITAHDWDMIYEINGYA